MRNLIGSVDNCSNISYQCNLYGFLSHRAKVCWTVFVRGNISYFSRCVGYDSFWSFVVCFVTFFFSSFFVCLPSTGIAFSISTRPFVISFLALSFHLFTHPSRFRFFFRKCIGKDILYIFILLYRSSFLFPPFPLFCVPCLPVSHYTLGARFKQGGKRGGRSSRQMLCLDLRLERKKGLVRLPEFDDRMLHFFDNFLFRLKSLRK